MIEQHLCKVIEVDVPDGLELGTDEIIKEENKVYDDFKNGKIILTSDDYNGVTLTSSILNGESSEWVNL